MFSLECYIPRGINLKRGKIILGEKSDSYKNGLVTGLPYRAQHMALADTSFHYVFYAHWDYV